MVFELLIVVFWGRILDEYKMMFVLSDEDLKKLIVSFGDGFVSFNFEMKRLNNNVILFDLIYIFIKE